VYYTTLYTRFRTWRRSIVRDKRNFRPLCNCCGLRYENFRITHTRAYCFGTLPVQLDIVHYNIITHAVSSKNRPKPPAYDTTSKRQRRFRAEIDEILKFENLTDTWRRDIIRYPSFGLPNILSGQNFNCLCDIRTNSSRFIVHRFIYRQFFFVIRGLKTVSSCIGIMYNALDNRSTDTTIYRCVSCAHHSSSRPTRGDFFFSRLYDSTRSGRENSR